MWCGYMEVGGVNREGLNISCKHLHDCDLTRNFECAYSIGRCLSDIADSYVLVVSLLCRLVSRVQFGV
jgi:hypothetical protein